MSVAFTNPYSAPTGQLWRTLRDEIILTYGEHRNVLGQPDQPASAWVSTTYYYPGNTVRYEGKHYKNIHTTLLNINHIPDEEGSIWWEEVAYILSPQWFSDVTFTLGQRCRYGTSALTGTMFWVSLQDGNTGHLPDEAESAWWKSATAIEVQGVTYWTELQAWLESYCASFIDHISGPLNVGQTGFLFWTLANWRTEAGLNATGFRRSTDNGATFSYGQMQRGDHIGPWIFEDLQKGFSALRWQGSNDPVWTPGFTSASYWNLVSGSWRARGPGTDITPMQYGGENGYFTFLYGMDPYFYYSGSKYPGHFFAGVFYSGDGSTTNSRKRVDATFQKIAGLNGSADIYFRGKSYPGWYLTPTFDDLDGLGITNGGMLFYTTLASMDNTSTGLLGGTDMTFVAPSRGYSCDLLVNKKWNFTNQNA